MPQRNAERAARQEREEPAAKVEELTPVEFSPTYIEDAARRLDKLKSSAEGDLDDKTRAKLESEISELEQFVTKHRKPKKPHLRVVRSIPDTAPPPEPAEPESPRRKLTVKEIDQTLVELRAQRDTLRGRLTDASGTREANTIRGQINRVGREVDDLVAEREVILNRHPKRGITKQGLEAMGASFQESLAARQAEEHVADLRDQERHRALGRLAEGKPAKEELELAETESEKEFFETSEEEAWKRAESSETRRFIDHLHKEFPDYVRFTGAEYVQAKSAPAKKVGFWKKLLGAKGDLQLMNDALDSVPNVGRLYESFIAGRAASQKKSVTFKGVRGR